MDRKRAARASQKRSPQSANGGLAAGMHHRGLEVDRGEAADGPLAECGQCCAHSSLTYMHLFIPDPSSDYGYSARHDGGHHWGNEQGCKNGFGVNDVQNIGPDSSCTSSPAVIRRSFTSDDRPYFSEDHGMTWRAGSGMFCL